MAIKQTFTPTVLRFVYDVGHSRLLTSQTLQTAKYYLSEELDGKWKLTIVGLADKPVVYIRDTEMQAIELANQIEYKRICDWLRHDLGCSVRITDGD